MTRTTFQRVIALMLLAGFTGVALTSAPQAQERPRPYAVRQAVAGKLDQRLTEATVISNDVNPAKERAVLDVPLPAVLDSVELDAAELVMMVSTQNDSTDPLVFAVAPVSDRALLMRLEDRGDWTGRDDGSNMSYVTLTSMNSTEDAAEVRLDITPIVELWLKGKIPNRGLVVRALTEDKSTFQLIQTGIYGGANARVEFMYSRRYK